MSGDYEFPIGAIVSVTGVIVGRSEFSDKPPTYWIEYERQGKVVRDWFDGGDLDEATVTDGGGI